MSALEVLNLTVAACNVCNCFVFSSVLDLGRKLYFLHITTVFPYMHGVPCSISLLNDDQALLALEYLAI